MILSTSIVIPVTSGVEAVEADITAAAGGWFVTARI
jgi:hypothetical protein